MFRVSLGLVGAGVGVCTFHDHTRETVLHSGAMVVRNTQTLVAASRVALLYKQQYPSGGWRGAAHWRQRMLARGHAQGPPCAHCVCVGGWWLHSWRRGVHFMWVWHWSQDEAMCGWATVAAACCCLLYACSSLPSLSVVHAVCHIACCFVRLCVCLCGKFLFERVYVWGCGAAGPRDAPEYKDAAAIVHQVRMHACLSFRLRVCAFCLCVVMRVFVSVHLCACASACPRDLVQCLAVRPVCWLGTASGWALSSECVVALVVLSRVC
jgi:hypothetical protein